MGFGENAIFSRSICHLRCDFFFDACPWRDRTNLDNDSCIGILSTINMA